MMKIFIGFPVSFSITAAPPVTDPVWDEEGSHPHKMTIPHDTDLLQVQKHKRRQLEVKTADGGSGKDDAGGDARGTDALRHGAAAGRRRLKKQARSRRIGGNGPASALLDCDKRPANKSQALKFDF